MQKRLSKLLNVSVWFLFGLTVGMAVYHVFLDEIVFALSYVIMAVFLLSNSYLSRVIDRLFALLQKDTDMIRNMQSIMEDHMEVCPLSKDE